MGKRKRQPKPGGDEKRRQTAWKSIQGKCHPAMFEMAQLWKESIEALRNAGPSPSKEAVEAIDARVSDRTVEIHNRYPDLASLEPTAFAAQRIYSESALTSPSDVLGVFEWLHFERHGIPFKQDEEDARKGDWEASRRVQRTISDTEQLRCGKGPIIPFQENLEHSNIFETMWGLGIEQLTPEELADFFDKYCPCGIEVHNPNTLNKYRDRFQKSIARNLLGKP